MRPVRYSPYGVDFRANERIRTSDQTPQTFAIRVSLNLLSYISIEPVEGLEPPTSTLQVWHSAIKVTPAFYVLPEGLEPSPF